MRYLDYWHILVVMPLLLTCLFIIECSDAIDYTFMVFVLGYIIIFHIVDKH